MRADRRGSMTRLLPALTLALSTAACSGVENPFSEDLFRGWNGSTRSIPAPDTPSTDLAIAALVRGDLSGAENHVITALRENPDNPYTLLAAAVLYENTGRPDLARRFYGELRNRHGDLPLPQGSWRPFPGETLGDMAMARIQALDSQSMPMDAFAGDSALFSGEPMIVARMDSAMMQDAMPVGRTERVLSAMPPGEANAVRRFLVMKRLLDDGLVTQSEVRTRRDTNLGAILPYSHEPPAAGLERPVPDGDTVVGRLTAMRRAMEMRSTTPREHAAEREIILDALLPDEPRVRAEPMPPPSGLMDAASRVGRVEQLRTLGLISDSELTAEKAAIEAMLRDGQVDMGAATMPEGTDKNAGHSMQGTDPRMLVPMPMQGSKPMMKSDSDMAKTDAMPKPAAPMAGGFSFAVHLASYRSEAAAMAGWKTLQKQHASALGSLSPSVDRTDLGPGKGVYYRLKAGPLSDRQAAETLCSSLKARRQYCAPTFVTG